MTMAIQRMLLLIKAIKMTQIMTIRISNIQIGTRGKGQSKDGIKGNI